MTSSTSQAVVRALDHVGLVVPDADQASVFLVEALGAREAYRHGPYPVGGAPGRHPDTLLKTIVMLQLDYSTIELLEFDAPDQRSELPRTVDLGAFHLAFYTDDIDAAVERLCSLGATILMPVRDLIGPDSGPGARMAYVLTPWGLPMELVTYPGGRQYERTAAVRLFDPRTATPGGVAK